MNHQDPRTITAGGIIVVLFVFMVIIVCCSLRRLKAKEEVEEEKPVNGRLLAKMFRKLRQKQRSKPPPYLKIEPPPAIDKQIESLSKAKSGFRWKKKWRLKKERSKLKLKAKRKERLERRKKKVQRWAFFWPSLSNSPVESNRDWAATKAKVKSQRTVDAAPPRSRKESSHTKASTSDEDKDDDDSNNSNKR